MIGRYTTKCPYCGTEEEFVSTSEENSCGTCGKMTQVLTREEIIIKKEKNDESDDQMSG